ncbi:MAG: hypothetical protein DCF19_05765 [Pseudanabaena frigida]|uniref:Uncharacterized protein n=1 Tax=Pseudanabaena frigida TaxID=945775 RepID=A0A2W4WEY6_9CYAN|nr:MAG: hypothetical protein DCF19_05765 [Pseudanabaena frigida]
MQVSPPHSQRQLISGKVGWGWRQATYPISVNFGFAGFLMLMVAIAQLLQTGDLNLLSIAGFLILVGILLGIFTARKVVEVCRQNSEYSFSQLQLIGIGSYWLVLIGGLIKFSEPLSKVFVAIWWILPAAIFTGISISLALRSSKPKPTNRTKQSLESASLDFLNADVLNVVTYSDRTVLVSPSSLGQQPRQFNSLVMIVLGFFFWTMLDFPSAIRAIAAIAFTVTGLTGFFTWQAQLRSPEKILNLRFSGLWGISAEYEIDLRPFTSLSIVKLQEANGELSWMQLSGSSREITMPLAMTLAGQTKDAIKEGEPANQNDRFAQTIREEFHLAKQETERDSLGLANVLLPQGAGILAGTAFVAVGVLVLCLFPLPAKLSAESAISCFGVCVVSPAIARLSLQLVAPNSLQSDRQNHLKNYLQSWEIGTAILLVVSFLSTQATAKVGFPIVFNQILPLITLICGWLSVAIGVCLLAFVRRTPLWNNTY